MGGRHPKWALRGPDCDCGECSRRYIQNDGGTMNSSVFASKPQRDDPSITNDYFNAGKQDGADHGHAKYRENPDGSTDYFYVRDVEGNEYDV